MKTNVNRIKLIGSFTKLIYEGNKANVYLLKGEHNGLLQVGVPEDVNVSFKTEYVLTVSLYGKQKQYDDGRLYYNNYLELISLTESNKNNGGNNNEEKTIN